MMARDMTGCGTVIGSIEYLNKQAKFEKEPNQLLTNTVLRVQVKQLTFFSLKQLSSKSRA